MLAGGGGAQIIYSAAVGRQPTPSAYAASPYYLLPSGYEPSEGELQRPGWSHGAGRVGRRWRGRSARGLLRALSSWPARARCGRVADVDLTDAFRAGHVLEAAPFGGQHEQRALAGPPSIHAKQPRSRSMDCSTSPPLRTRTQRWPGTSAYQTAPSVSRQIPSGKPPGRLAQGVHPCHEGCHRRDAQRPALQCAPARRPGLLGAAASHLLLLSWAIREIGTALQGRTNGEAGGGHIRLESRESRGKRES